MRPGLATLLTCAMATAPAAAQEWPSYRGVKGSGVADGTNPPTTWNGEQSVGIRWKTPIPGMGHSSPIIWGDRVFITTAVAEDDRNLTFRYGAAATTEGAAAASKDNVQHSWRVYALDKRTGKILWERVATEGIPRTGRHVKASQANATPVTDGRHLIVSFGSEGVYCYDLDGRLLWKKDFGPLRSGFYWDPTYEWNTASSPVIFKNLVFLQIDLVKDSYIAALDVATGKQVWRTERDEIPTWGTPLVYEGPPRTELITQGRNALRAYDPLTGKEFWRLGGHSDVTIPTPLTWNGLIFATSGQGPIFPIYAIRPGANGDITLKDGEDSNEYVVWSKRRGGPYTPTPILYDGILYVCSSNGILAAYRAETGELLYRDRIGGKASSFTASAVAADGRLYYASEDGEVFVLKAGPKYELLATNPMGEVMMATPAISQGMMVIRMQRHVVGVGEAK